MINKLRQWFQDRKAKKELTGTDLEKQLATNHEESWVSVVGIEFEADDPTVGNFQLDWNEYFIEFLTENGYSGRTEEDIVNQWMNDLCAGIAQDILDPRPDTSEQDIKVQEISPGKKIHR